MEKEVIRIFNNHIPECGEPPAINTEKENEYYGYFETCDHEQLVFIYDYDTDKAIVKMGDINWSRDIEVVDGKPTGKFGLGVNELAWLDLCWKAAKYI